MKEQSELKTAEQLKAKALRYIVENYGDDLAKEDPDAAALIMEVFIDAYNLDRPTPPVETKTAEEILDELSPNRPWSKDGGTDKMIVKAIHAYHAQFTPSAKSVEVEEAAKNIKAENSLEARYACEEFIKGNAFRSDIWVDVYYLAGVQFGSNWQQQKQAETISQLTESLRTIYSLAKPGRAIYDICDKTLNPPQTDKG